MRKREFMSSGRRGRQHGESTGKLPTYTEKKNRKVKAQHELNLATMVKDNKKCFYKYNYSKRRNKENLHYLLDAGGN